MRSTARRLRPLTWLFVVIGVLATMLALSWWQFASERAAVVGLPSAERKALYERTLHTLQTTCRKRPEGLDAYCAAQTDLIVQFPECDDACNKLARAQRAGPTK